MVREEEKEEGPNPPTDPPTSSSSLYAAAAADGGGGLFLAALFLAPPTFLPLQLLACPATSPLFPCLPNPFPKRKKDLLRRRRTQFGKPFVSPPSSKRCSISEIFPLSSFSLSLRLPIRSAPSSAHSFCPCVHLSRVLFIRRHLLANSGRLLWKSFRRTLSVPS